MLLPKACPKCGGDVYSDPDLLYGVSDYVCLQCGWREASCGFNQVKEEIGRRGGKSLSYSTSNGVRLF